MSGVLARVAERLNAMASEPEPHQVPPGNDWRFFLLLGGRGSGKSWAVTKLLDEHAKGPPCLAGSIPHRMAVIAPTLGDAAQSCFKEPAGVRAHDPLVRLVPRHGGTFIVWPNGAEAKLFGAHTAEDADRLRSGGNNCFVAIDELAACRWAQLVWDHMEMGLRVGPNPRGVIATTPKPKPIIRRLIADDRVAVARATTADNPHLELSRREEIIARYQGTRLGRQEIMGEILDEVEGALWDVSTLDVLRVAEAPGIWRAAVGVDPSAWLGQDAAEAREDQAEEGKGIETGIVAVGLGSCPARPEDTPCTHQGLGVHVYRLADASGRMMPAEWGAEVVRLYHWLASITRSVEVTPETNHGGAMVLNTIRSVPGGEHVRFTMTNGKPGVRASDGKRARAEPVAALEEQGRAHSVGSLEVLEGQMCAWLPTENWSPDRVDAYVWAVHALNPWQAKGAKTKTGAGTVVRRDQSGVQGRRGVPGARGVQPRSFVYQPRRSGTGRA